MYYTPYLIPVLILALYGVVTGIYIIKKKRTQASLIGGILIFASVLWLLTLLLEAISLELSHKVFWDAMQFIGIGIVPAGGLLYASVFTGKDRWISPRAMLLLSLVPAAMFVLALTNGHHAMVWTDHRIVQVDSLVLRAWQNMERPTGCIWSTRMLWQRWGSIYLFAT